MGGEGGGDWITVERYQMERLSRYFVCLVSFAFVRSQTESITIKRSKRYNGQPQQKQNSTRKKIYRNQHLESNITQPQPQPLLPTDSSYDCSLPTFYRPSPLQTHSLPPRDKAPALRPASSPPEPTVSLRRDDGGRPV